MINLYQSNDHTASLASCVRIENDHTTLLVTSSECRAFKADVRVCQKILVSVFFYMPVNQTLQGVAICAIYKHFMLLRYIAS